MGKLLRFCDQAAFEHLRATGIDAFVQQSALRVKTKIDDAIASQTISALLPHLTHGLACGHTYLNGPNDLWTVIRVNAFSGWCIHAAQDLMQVRGAFNFFDSSEAVAQFL